MTAIMMTIHPTTPMRAIIGVTYLSVSTSVIPLIRPTTQNPLSFIQATAFDPQPMASAR